MPRAELESGFEVLLPLPQLASLVRDDMFRDKEAWQLAQRVNEIYRRYVARRIHAPVDVRPLIPKGVQGVPPWSSW